MIKNCKTCKRDSYCGTITKVNWGRACANWTAKESDMDKSCTNDCKHAIINELKRISCSQEADIICSMIDRNCGNWTADAPDGNCTDCGWYKGLPNGLINLCHNPNRWETPMYRNDGGLGCGEWKERDAPKSCDDCKWFRGDGNACQLYQNIGIAKSGHEFTCGYHEEKLPHKLCSTCVHTTEVDDYTFCDIPIREIPPYMTLSGAGYNCDFWIEKNMPKTCGDCSFYKKTINNLTHGSKYKYICEHLGNESSVEENEVACNYWAEKDDTLKLCPSCEREPNCNTITFINREEGCAHWAEKSVTTSCLTCKHTKELNGVLLCKLTDIHLPVDKDNCEFHTHKNKCDSCKWVKSQYGGHWCKKKRMKVINASYECWEGEDTDPYSKLGRFPCWLVPVYDPLNKCDSCCHKCKIEGVTLCDSWREHEDEPTIHVEISGFSLSTTNCDECVNFEREKQENCLWYAMNGGTSHCGHPDKDAYCWKVCSLFEKEEQNHQNCAWHFHRNDGARICGHSDSGRTYCVQLCSYYEKTSNDN